MAPPWNSVQPGTAPERRWPAHSAEEHLRFSVPFIQFRSEDAVYHSTGGFLDESLRLHSSNMAVDAGPATKDGPDQDAGRIVAGRPPDLASRIEAVSAIDIWKHRREIPVSISLLVLLPLSGFLRNLP